MEHLFFFFHVLNINYILSKGVNNSDIYKLYFMHSLYAQFLVIFQSDSHFVKCAGLTLLNWCSMNVGEEGLMFERKGRV